MKMLRMRIEMTIDLKGHELLTFKWKDTQTGLTHGWRNKAIKSSGLSNLGVWTGRMFYIANAVLDLYSIERRKSFVSVDSTLNVGDQLPQKK